LELGDEALVGIGEVEAAELAGATDAVAFPAISTGIYRWPLESAADIALSTVAEELTGDTSVQLVRFVLFGQSAYDVFRSRQQLH
jgi:O-acetyl-ADP-ribose deacetylase (regulator of RNase III)